MEKILERENHLIRPTVANLDQAAYFVIMIEADPVSVGNGHQKKIEQDLHGGKIPKKSAGDKTMIDPAERSLNLTDP